MQINLEAECRNKVEAMRVKKKLEQDINDLEMALDAVNKAKIESEKNFKKYQQQIRDLQQHLEEEQRARLPTLYIMNIQHGRVCLAVLDHDYSTHQSVASCTC